MTIENQDATQHAEAHVAAVAATSESSPLSALTSSLPEVSPVAPGSNFQEVDENPMLLVETGSALHKDGTCFHVQLFGSGCLDCTHLVADAEVTYKKCHFSQGNMHCPAAYFKIEYIGDRVIWEKKVSRIEAMPSGVDRTNRKLELIDAAREIDDADLRHRVLSLLGL